MHTSMCIHIYIYIYISNYICAWSEPVCASGSDLLTDARRVMCRGGATRKKYCPRAPDFLCYLHRCVLCVMLCVMFMCMYGCLLLTCVFMVE